MKLQSLKKIAFVYVSVAIIIVVVTLEACKKSSSSPVANYLQTIRVRNIIGYNATGVYPNLYNPRRIAISEIIANGIVNQSHDKF